MVRKGALSIVVLILLLQLTAAVAESDTDSAFNTAVQQKLRTAAYTAIGITIALIALLAIRIAIQKPKNPWGTINFMVLVAILCLIGYSYYYYQLTASEAEGILVCEAGQCFWAAHTHATLSVTICGEELDVGLEEGPLEATHTHKERGKLHFHERLPVDPETKQVTNWDPLRLQAIFDAAGIRFTPSCIADKCNGDPCNGKPGTLTMTVNGALNPQFGQYTWQDGDDIRITFS